MSWPQAQYFDPGSPTDAEQVAAQGLNIKSYAGKWEEAQQLAHLNLRQDDNRLLPYWERVRLLFLELGGEYLNQDPDAAD